MSNLARDILNNPATNALPRAALERELARKPRRNRPAPRRPEARISDQIRSMFTRLPMETPNPLNKREHWAARSKRTKEQRATACYSLLRLPLPALPVTVTLTRVGVRELDPHDGLPASLKPIVDGIADAYGLASDANERLKIVYAQEKGTPEVKVRIERTTK